MSAATEIRERYADIIAQAERQARADAGMICSICTGDHRTNDCNRGQLYIYQCEHSTISDLPKKMRPIRRELAEAIALIYEALETPPSHLSKII